jgi:ABC-type Co2+ transport system permease subunit
MHIEPGLIAQPKLAFAAVAAAGLLGGYAPQLFKRPALLLRTALAALFFSLFMQAFHLPVGPSELHFLGAMPIYLAFGFLPTLFGFALGLLLQGLLFEPQDLVHLAVNTLSLAVPLVAVHYTLGRKLATVSVQTILKLDSAYYAGVIAMVGFWLMLGQTATPLADWARFGASYLPVVIAEPLLTFALLALIKRYGHTRLVATCFSGQGLNLALPR